MTEAINPKPAENPNKRAFIMLGVAGGLVVLFLLYSVLLGGGGGGGDGSADSAAPADAPAAVPETTTTTAGTPETFEVFTAKNPFQPPTSPIGTGTPTTSPPGTTVTTSPGTSPTGGTGGTGGSGTTPTSAMPAAEPRRGERLAMIEITQAGGRTLVDVRVGGTAYRVGEGDEFASSYRVVSIDTATNCARFVFGDDQFRLCVGEEVIK